MKDNGIYVIIGIIILFVILINSNVIDFSRSFSITSSISEPVSSKESVSEVVKHYVIEENIGIFAIGDTACGSMGDAGCGSGWHPECFVEDCDNCGDAFVGGVKKCSTCYFCVRDEGQDCSDDPSMSLDCLSWCEDGWIYDYGDNTCCPQDSPYYMGGGACSTNRNLDFSPYGAQLPADNYYTRRSNCDVFVFGPYSNPNSILKEEKCIGNNNFVCEIESDFINIFQSQGTVIGECGVQCLSNGDCPDDEVFGNKFCDGLNVAQQTIDYSCSGFQCIGAETSKVIETCDVKCEETMNLTTNELPIRPWYSEIESRNNCINIGVDDKNNPVFFIYHGTGCTFWGGEYSLIYQNLDFANIKSLDFDLSISDRGSQNVMRVIISIDGNILYTKNVVHGESSLEHLVLDVGGYSGNHRLEVKAISTASSGSGFGGSVTHVYSIGNLKALSEEQLTVTDAICSACTEDNIVLINEIYHICRGGLYHPVLDLVEFSEEEQQDLLDLINQLETTIEEKAQLISNLELTLQQQGEIVNDLEASIEEKALLIQSLTINIDEQNALIEQLELSLNEKIILVQSLELNIQEQAQTIVSLTSQAEEQTQIISNLNLNIQQQANLIDEMELTIFQQAIIIEDLDLEISQQATIIDNLNLNLQQKIELISQLELTNEQQTQLIETLSLSFSEQQEILDALNIMIENDAQQIIDLQLSLSESANYINNLELTVSQQADLINQLQLTNQEQAELISQLNLNNEQTAQLIANLNLQISQQADIIDALDLTIQDDAEIIANLNLKLAEEADLINSLHLTIDEQIELISQLELSVAEEKELVSRLRLIIEEQLEIIQALQEIPNGGGEYGFWEQYKIFIIIGVVIFALLLIGGRKT